MTFPPLYSSRHVAGEFGFIILHIRYISILLRFESKMSFDKNPHYISICTTKNTHQSLEEGGPSSNEGRKHNN